MRIVLQQRSSISAKLKLCSMLGLCFYIHPDTSEPPMGALWGSALWKGSGAEMNKARGRRVAPALKKENPLTRNEAGIPSDLLASAP